MTQQTGTRGIAIPVSSHPTTSRKWRCSARNLRMVAPMMVGGTVKGAGLERGYGAAERPQWQCGRATHRDQNYRCSWSCSLCAGQIWKPWARAQSLSGGFNYFALLLSVRASAPIPLIRCALTAMRILQRWLHHLGFCFLEAKETKVFLHALHCRTRPSLLTRSCSAIIASDPGGTCGNATVAPGGSAPCAASLRRGPGERC